MQFEMKYFLVLTTAVLQLFFCCETCCQETIKGTIIESATNEPIIGANVIIKGTAIGTVSDWDGSFEFTTDEALPITLEVSYIGFETKEIVLTEIKRLDLRLLENSELLTEIVVKGSRISEENKKTPLTVESLDVLAIKETPASNFYEGLGALKGVDMTTASLGFQVINTRGFNSTSPVRSLQIIDGVDNQAPGLNFSLGNFLGSSELDILKVDIIVGASSAFYGPNAFNGVISMQTKDPFVTNGLSGFLKMGERSLINGAGRFAKSFSNKSGLDWAAIKVNLEILSAADWEAENYTAVTDSESNTSNPGRYDAVNIYGDEYRPLFDKTTSLPWNSNTKNAGAYYRTGYRERDLLKYETRNLKSNVSAHFRLNPSEEHESSELIFCSSFSSGTTIYQGENRFSLKDITFFQNKVEIRKREKFFLRAYMTIDNAGNSYDPYFTALQLQQYSKGDRDWNSAYVNHWQQNIIPRMDAHGYPELDILRDEDGNLIIDPDTGLPVTDFDYEALDLWNAQNMDSLALWHMESEIAANKVNSSTEDFTNNFLEPGSDEYNEIFDKIRSTKSGEFVKDVNTALLGTRLVDRSALYHMHGEYTFKPLALNFLKVGANARLYRPQSEGTIFVDSIYYDPVKMDTVQNRISNLEVGAYAGVEKKITDDITISGTIRVDKNQNFNYLLSPAASLVYTPAENNYLRFSFSSAIRNPTLSDQYLDFDVGPATLRGNLNGSDSLVTIESFQDYRETLLQPDLRQPLEKFVIDPITPEKVKSFEVGYRTTLFEKLYVDAGYYFSIYDDFIGYNIGLEVALDGALPTSVKALRYSANSVNVVTTQGMSIGLNYFVGKYFKLGGNYSWNRLNSDIDDPIIPAFNTPEHKYNLGFSGRNMPLSLGGTNKNTFGFNFNYKWIQGFLFEGSPQFTGTIDDYSLLDGQVSYAIPNLNVTMKVGASNLLNNKVYQTYGGPLVGRLAYVKLLYDLTKKN